MQPRWVFFCRIASWVRLRAQGQLISCRLREVWTSPCRESPRGPGQRAPSEGLRCPANYLGGVRQLISCGPLSAEQRSPGRMGDQKGGLPVCSSERRRRPGSVWTQLGPYEGPGFTSEPSPTGCDPAGLGGICPFFWTDLTVSLRTVQETGHRSDAAGQLGGSADPPSAQGSPTSEARRSAVEVTRIL